MLNLTPPLTSWNNVFLRWNRYYHELSPLVQKEQIELVELPKGVQVNGHLFYLKCKDQLERSRLIQFLKQRSIQGLFSLFYLYTTPLRGKNTGSSEGKIDILHGTARVFCDCPFLPLCNQKSNREL